MRKNKMMRLSAILLVLVLLTTCVISGTYAKYVTSGKAEDSAVVAKWGVEVKANDTTVATTTEVGGATEDHIISKTAPVALAPGSQAVSLADFTITGDPEVAFNVSYVADLTLTGWVIDGSDEYCPLEINVNGQVFTCTGTIAEFETAVEEAIANLANNYAVDDDLSVATAPQVSVAWAFSTSDENDAKDTKLGNLATLPTLTLSITATVTQID